MAIIDVVKFDGLRSRDWLVYKFPSDTLVFGTRLIVNEGQVAVFVKGGQVCDLFYPGSYILDTDNLPVLFHIFNLPYGGNTPFTAEVYFINTKTKLDIPWGTSDPIQLIDPKYFVKLRIRAFGQMGLKLMDYSLFFRELIGSMNQNDIVSFDKIKLFYRGMVVTKVKSIISEMILAEKISALEISAHLDDISDKCREEISGEFQKYGFNVVNFFVQSINFPDDDFAKINKILEDKAAFEIMGDGRYVTKRSFDVYEGAANNNNGVAGAFAAGGIGAGVGMNVAQAAGGMAPRINPGQMVICRNAGKNPYREASSAIPAEQSWRWRKNAVPAAEKKMTGMPSSVMNAGSASWKEYANAGQSFRRALNSAMSAEGRYSKYSL